MEYYSAIEKNEILPPATTQMDPEGIVLNGVSQTEKDKCHMWNLENRINKQQKQTHIYREYFDGCQFGSGRSVKGEGIKRYKLVATK